MYSRSIFPYKFLLSLLPSLIRTNLIRCSRPSSLLSLPLLIILAFPNPTQPRFFYPLSLCHTIISSSQFDILLTPDTVQIAPRRFTNINFWLSRKLKGMRGTFVRLYPQNGQKFRNISRRDAYPSVLPIHANNSVQAHILPTPT